LEPNDLLPNKVIIVTVRTVILLCNQCAPIFVNWRCIGSLMVFPDIMYLYIYFLPASSLNSRDSSMRLSKSYVCVVGEFRSIRASTLLTVKKCFPHYTKNATYVFPEMKLRGLFPSSYIHVYISERFIHIQDQSAYLAAAK
jgi:hypothetical protein